MKHSIRPSMLALLSSASLMGATTASAELLPYSVSATNLTSPGQQTLNFARFDSALGTLTGVTFTLTSELANIAIGGGINATFSAGEGGSASGHVNAGFDIDGPSGDLYHGDGSATAQCSSSSGPNGGGCSAPAVVQTSPNFSPLTVTFTAPPDNLSAYIGGGFFDVFVELDVEAFLDTCSPSGGANCTVDGNASWAGQLEVTYRFTPAGAVPEPTTLALLGFGLAGLGFARRKR